MIYICVCLYRSSEERGWELFWLAAGLFAPCDPLLHNELEFFIQSRRDHCVVATNIEEKLTKTVQL